ncbi:MAG: hypothetical protein GY760_07570 [Deltaproteobacteria bacterium]|nr:hypothetical protein [Deltaproteobacteria bacterium]
MHSTKRGSDLVPSDLKKIHMALVIGNIGQLKELVGEISKHNSFCQSFAGKG